MQQSRMINGPITPASTLCRETNTLNEDLRDVRAGVLNQIKIRREDGSLVWKLNLPITIIGELRHAGYIVERSRLQAGYIISWVTLK